MVYLGQYCTSGVSEQQLDCQRTATATAVGGCTYASLRYIPTRGSAERCSEQTHQGAIPQQSMFFSLNSYPNLATIQRIDKATPA